MFNLVRASRVAPRAAIARCALQPASRRLVSSSQNASTNTAAANSTPTADAAQSTMTSTGQPVKSNNVSPPPKAAAPKPHPRSNPPAPTTRSSPSPSSSSSSSTTAADPVTISARTPNSKQGSNGLPFYTPKTIGFSQEDGVKSTGGSSSSNNNNTNADTIDIDWENSYHGISTQPATPAQFRVLMEPIAEQDIEVKPDGIIYLPEIKYRRRLNEAFGPMGWGLIPRSEPVLANGVATREYALVVGGRFVAQAQGENTYFNAEGMPSAVEGCKSNALMRCCKDLGIASELWDPVFIRAYKSRFMKEVWVEHATTKKKRQLWFKAGQINVAYPYKKV